MSCQKLVENFNQYFRVIYADSPELLKQVYKIRYDVFCTELELEKGCPKDVEKDRFDDWSEHFLLQHKATGQYAGTVRYVVPAANQPKDDLPFTNYCLDSVDRSIIDPAALANGSFAEVSRLAVPSQFRKRVGEKGKPYIIGTENKASRDEKRLFPYISVGLYLACAAYFVLNKHQLDYTFVMVEPRLARAMARIGIAFKQCGDIIEYHGQRAPFYISQDMLASNLKDEVLGLFEHITGELLQQLPTSGNAERLAV